MGRTKARRDLKVEFSQEGMKRLSEQIRQYSIDVLEANKTFVHRLAESGYDIATAKIVQSLHSIDRDKPIGTLDIIDDGDGHVMNCLLQFSSEQALFIEFGAGIRYNEGNQHPLAKKYGYGVGTYPNQTHANDKKGWAYFGRDGRWHHSYGTEGTMPIYSAGVDMRAKLVEIAKEVYQSVI